MARLRLTHPGGGAGPLNYSITARSLEPGPEIDPQDTETVREVGSLFTVDGVVVEGGTDSWDVAGVQEFTVDEDIITLFGPEGDLSLVTDPQEVLEGAEEPTAPPDTFPEDFQDVTPTRPETFAGQRFNEFRIPLSWANEIPGVSGVEDVVIRIPTVDFIAFQVAQFVPTVQDIAQGVIAALEEEGEALVDTTVEVSEGLFGDTIGNLDEIVAEAVDDALGDLGQAIDDLQGLSDDVSRLVEDFDRIDIPSVEDVEQAIQSELDALDIPEPPTVEEIEEAVGVDVPDIDIIEELEAFANDPAGFIADAIIQALEEATDEETAQQLQEEVEEGYAWD